MKNSEVSQLKNLYLHLQRINEHNLLDVPDGKPWLAFKIGVYGHIICTSILVVVGISCFCTGIENSFMYTDVNCTDGVSLTAPLVNIVSRRGWTNSLTLGNMQWQLAAIAEQKCVILYIFFQIRHFALPGCSALPRPPRFRPQLATGY